MIGEILPKLVPKFSGANADRQKVILNAIVPLIDTILPQFAIDTPLRIAHFLAQICHESAGLRTTEEFASGQAYEGRADLGNTSPGDGVLYKGRGLIQLTGRANYKKYGKLMQLPLETNPKLAADPVISLYVACTYWQEQKINKVADQDDLERVTRKVNGGLNGLKDRRGYLLKAKELLGASFSSAITQSVPSVGYPLCRLGQTGWVITVLQEALGRHGFSVGKVDSVFGPKTKKSVVAFQRSQGLLDDGVVGQRTWALLIGDKK